MKTDLSFKLIPLFLFFLIADFVNAQNVFLKNHIIKVEANWKDEETGQMISMLGAGIIVGQELGEIFALTAFHTVKEAHPDSIVVTFYQEPFFPTIAQVVFSDELSDVAVLKIAEVPATIPFFDKIPKVQNNKYKAFQLVQVVGFPGGSIDPVINMEMVQEVDNTLLKITQNHILPGHSGGGVFLENDHLIGMALKKGSSFAKVLSANRLLKLCEDWKVPINLISGPNPELLEWSLLSGGTLLYLFGAYSKGLSNENYEIYKQLRNFDPNGIYQVSDREDIYDKANSNHKVSVISKGLGVLVFAVGTIRLTKKFFSKINTRKAGRLTFAPILDHNLSSNKGQIAITQIGLRVNF